MTETANNSAADSASSAAGSGTQPTHELVLERVFDAPPARVYQAWTDPEILKKWFAPKPFTTPRAELDVRPGGSSTIVMRDPDGNDYPNKGVYLEVVPNRKLVTTDAYVEAWQPSPQPFMTMILTFEDAGDGRTNARYVIRHWTEEARKQHEEMGFYEGWGQCADQLAELLANG